MRGNETSGGTMAPLILGSRAQGAQKVRDVLAPLRRERSKVGKRIDPLNPHDLEDRLADRRLLNWNLHQIRSRPTLRSLLGVADRFDLFGGDR